MLKKLTEEKLEQILEAGISEFAEHGLQQTSMVSIAERAGISVGVLYKYYENKIDFFNACVVRCTSKLELFLNELISHDMKPLDYARELIGEVQRFSCQHRDYIRLYHEATRCNDRQQAELLAKQIEGISSKLYTGIIRKEQLAGNVRGDLDPQLFAFFFDNLLMMVQFSYCCPYYQERLRLYAGEHASDNELITDQLLKFMESAFTFEQTSIPHKEKQEKSV